MYETLTGQDAIEIAELVSATSSLSGSYTLTWISI